MKNHQKKLNRRNFLEHSAKITAAGILMNRLPAATKKLISIRRPRCRANRVSWNLLFAVWARGWVPLSVERAASQRPPRFGASRTGRALRGSC